MSSTYRVAPFGHLRIKGYLHLPAAFRSLSRPSSPLRAQASTIRPYLFTLIFSTNLAFSRDSTFYMFISSYLLIIVLWNLFPLTFSMSKNFEFAAIFIAVLCGE